MTEELNNFFSTAKNGTLISRSELVALSNKLSQLIEIIIPEWYIDLLANYPLAGAELSFQNFPPEKDFDGISTILFHDVFMLEEINTFDSNRYATSLMLHLGYFAFGECASAGSQCQYTFSVNAGTNPPDYCIWCDDSSTSKEFLIDIQKGDNLISSSFTDLLRISVK